MLRSIGVLILLTGFVSSPQKNATESADSAGILQNSSATLNAAFIDINSSPSKLPPEIQYEIWPLIQEYRFTVNKWEFDPNKSNEINLYAHDILNEFLIEELQGRQIDYYTIHISHDTEFKTTRSEVRRGSLHPFGTGRKEDHPACKEPPLLLRGGHLRSYCQGRALVFVGDVVPECDRLRQRSNH